MIKKYSQLKQASTNEDIDKPYFEAIAKKDNATLAKMVREYAQMQGYNIGPVYHGSYSNFNVFNMDYFGRTDAGYYGQAFYFSPDIENAAEYGNVREFFLNCKKPLKLPAHSSMGHESLLDAQDILADIYDRPDLKSKRNLPKGYYLKKGIYQDGDYGYFPGAKNVYYSVYPNKELYGTPEEIYGPKEPSELFAINAFYDRLAEYQDKKTSRISYSWLHGLVQDFGRKDLISRVAKKGYDSLFIVDADTKEVEEYLVWSPKQIKLTAKKTFDDNGNPIPQKQRFDSNNPDIRY